MKSQLANIIIIILISMTIYPAFAQDNNNTLKSGTIPVNLLRPRRSFNSYGSLPKIDSNSLNEIPRFANVIIIFRIE
jgi:hypothetical protein